MRTSGGTSRPVLDGVIPRFAEVWKAVILVRLEALERSQPEDVRLANIIDVVNGCSK